MQFTDARVIENLLQAVGRLWSQQQQQHVPINNSGYKEEKELKASCKSSFGTYAAGCDVYGGCRQFSFDVHPYTYNIMLNLERYN